MKDDEERNWFMETQARVNRELDKPRRAKYWGARKTPISEIVTLVVAIPCLLWWAISVIRFVVHRG